MPTLFDTPVAEPKTQTGRLLKWFKNGNSITSLEATLNMGITQLGARITELERKGHSFDRPRVKLPSGKVVCEYRLKGD